ncbi:Serine/threonine kinase PKN8 [Enhygromyxa salina]|uniref:Serine/threonine kinase PKN8 n=1 Tax=Enhygromyxa salina TaxID=215803 RepID=A0A0C1ZUF9_9BACT|nr:Serine/threonine kinase PKN8 [Enhygromyxa salina]
MAQFGAGPAPVVTHRYQILDLRGRGANGVVCRARDTKLNRIVALKLYPRFDDESIELETLREAQALAQLEHPNVVRIYDHDRGTVEAGEARLACLFVSMEFIDGRHLKAWLAESERSRADVLRALVAAGDGLAAAHEAGLIHRDFKPENVMIDNSDRVRVVDFGLARGLSVENSEDGRRVGRAHQVMVSARFTRPGLAPGTPEYMAPEALDGHASASSDQFSFATAAWESLTGHLPSENDAASESLGRGDPASQLPTRLRSALQRGLALTPEGRYAELGELLDELRGVERQKRTYLVGAALVSFVAILVGAGWALGARVPEPAATPVETASVASPPAVDKCANLVGTWHYDTVVIWASDSVRWHGATGHYELEIEQLDGCAMNASLRKTGDGPRHYAKNLVREGARGVRVVRTSNGHEFSSEFVIASEKHGKITYAFNYVFADDQVSGDYQYLGADNVVWTGILRGGRTPPTTELSPDLRQASCTSQCRVRCPSPNSSDDCIERRCTSERVDVPDCGPPPADQTVPPLARELVRASLDSLRTAVDEDDKGRRWCTKAAETLPGHWMLWTGATVTELDVRVSDCELELVDRRTGERMHGQTTSVGAWVVAEPNSDWVRWALVGWDPAFGVGATGIPLVAHRRQNTP